MKIGIAKKGKKLSEESKRKIGLAQKGKKLSEATKRKIKYRLKGQHAGKNNPFHGKKHSE